MKETKIWLWRAWTSDRRIVDCGHAIGDTESEARQIAFAAIGGPLVKQLKSVEVVCIGIGRSLTMDEIRSLRS